MMLAAYIVIGFIVWIAAGALVAKEFNFDDSDGMGEWAMVVTAGLLIGVFWPALVPLTIIFFAVKYLIQVVIRQQEFPFTRAAVNERIGRKLSE